MLKLIKTPRSKYPDAHIIVPPEMSLEDRERLEGLADIFSAHHATNPEAYIMTESRGRKCWLLYSQGFRAAGEKSKTVRRAIVHPSGGQRLIISQAVACARLMEVKQMEAWA